MTRTDTKTVTAAPAFRSYEDVTREIRSRYSVTDLTEQTDEDLARGDEMFYRSDGDLKIFENGAMGGILLWTVVSGEGKEYEVRRFKNFVWCSCRDFFFRKKMCKHLALTVGVLCQKCHELRARVGKYCYECDQVTHPFGRSES